ncbi:MAG TPA: universal stress protein [Bacteroidia bacterium]|nr:universal stress protein [Bacteroidia bacterium]
MNLILCPTDFSRNATNAIQYAAALSDGISARLIIMHVYDKPVMFSDAPLTRIAHAAEQIKQNAEKKMNQLVGKLKRKYKNVTFEVMSQDGLAPEKLLQVAKKLSVDMIVMGSTGTSKIERLLIGSTTARIIRDAPCPVLSIPKNAVFGGIQKIVFATDLNEDNISSAGSISVFAKKFDAEISFLYVDDKHLLHSDEQIAAMTQKIRKRVKYGKISGYVSKNTSITKGIEYFLKKKPADILVMFTHARHFPDSMFNSSITKMMSHQANIPLLALKHSDKPLLAAG